MRTRDAVIGPSGAGRAPTPTATDVPPAPSGPVQVAHTRTSRAWVRVVPALVLLAVTLVFVLQNLRSTNVSFVAVSGRLPLGVALLAAAALGGLLVFTLGSMRIIQLRRTIHRSSGRRSAGRPVRTS